MKLNLICIINSTKKRKTINPKIRPKTFVFVKVLCET